MANLLSKYNKKLRWIFPSELFLFAKNFSFILKFKYGTFSNLKVPNIILTGHPTYLPTDAFENNTELTEFKIPSGVTEIGFTSNGMLSGYTFSGCSNLTDLYIPISVKSINSYVFSGCNKLTNIYYEGSREDFSQFRT